MRDITFQAISLMLALTIPAGCDRGSSDVPDALVDAETDGPDGPSPPGIDCSCDTDCRRDPGHRAICVFGVCMLRPSIDQTCDGPYRSCPDGMQLREVYEYGGFVCYPECAHFECEGDCDRFGACIDTEDTDFWCDPECAAYCSDDSV